MDSWCGGAGVGGGRAALEAEVAALRAARGGDAAEVARARSLSAAFASLERAAIQLDMANAANGRVAAEAAAVEARLVELAAAGGVAPSVAEKQLEVALLQRDRQVRAGRQLHDAPDSEPRRAFTIFAFPCSMTFLRSDFIGHFHGMQSVRHNVARKRY